jgi:hypothetical protein
LQDREKPQGLQGSDWFLKNFEASWSLMILMFSLFSLRP